MHDLVVIIMAGGLGKRMLSETPKVLHLLDNKPMLVRVLETSFLLNPSKILVVVGKYKIIIETTLQKYISLEYMQKIDFVEQPEPNGTGDAVKCCLSKLTKYNNHTVLILSGDVPLVSKETILETIECVKECKIVVTIVDNPSGLGRILLKDKKFIRIIEDKDCNDSQKQINIVNTGIYAFNSNILCKYLPYISNNNIQREYYLTDIVEIIKMNEKIDIEMFEIAKERQYELTGVNTRKQLLQLNELYLELKMYVM